MNTSTMIRTAVAAGVAGAGLAVGGVALASADDGATTVSTRAEAPDHGGRGPGGPGGPGGHVDAASLADALGVSEEDLTAALEAVHEELRPSDDADRSGPPSEAEREERAAALAAALAAELDLDEAEVTAALEQVREDRSAERRDALVERLDEAVDDGDLTAEDKESVLKAYDAGVLGGHP